LNLSPSSSKTYSAEPNRLQKQKTEKNKVLNNKGTNENKKNVGGKWNSKKVNNVEYKKEGKEKKTIK
jgi:hypothetical protein